MRSLVRETSPPSHDLIDPVFVEEGITDPIPIPTMPGITRVPERMLAREIARLAADGLRAVTLFGISHRKDAHGSDTWDPNGLMARSHGENDADRQAGSP